MAKTVSTRQSEKMTFFSFIGKSNINILQVIIYRFLFWFKGL